MLRAHASPPHWEGGRRGQWHSGRAQLRTCGPCELQRLHTPGLACVSWYSPDVSSWVPHLGCFCFEKGVPVARTGSTLFLGSEQRSQPQARLCLGC